MTPVDTSVWIEVFRMARPVDIESQGADNGHRAVRTAIDRIKNAAIPSTALPARLLSENT